MTTLEGVRALVEWRENRANEILGVTHNLYKPVTVDRLPPGSRLVLYDDGKQVASFGIAAPKWRSNQECRNKIRKAIMEGIYFDAHAIIIPSKANTDAD